MDPKVFAIQKIQDYIEAHIDEELPLGVLSEVAGYSESYTSRMFKRYVGMALSKYVRNRKLSVAADRIAATSDNILDVALDMSFESHEGFTRAFYKQFGLNPLRYRSTTPPIPLFIARSIRDYYNHVMEGVEVDMTERAIFVQEKTRPARKLIYMPGIKAEEYWSYCEEVGCDVWGVLCSMKGALDEPLGLWVADSMLGETGSRYIQGVEVPLDYEGITPEGMKVMEMPEQLYLEFVGEPFEPEDMGPAIKGVMTMIDKYEPTRFGYEFCNKEAPRYQYSPEPDRGYIEGVPVSRVRK